MKPEKTPAFGLPVTTKPNKQWQRLNLYGRFIQMASDLRRWWAHTLTDHLFFSFQVNLYIPQNKQGAVRWGLWDSGRIRWKKLQHSCPGQLAILGGVWSCLSLEHKGLDASSCPLLVIFSSAPGAQLFSQEPGWALSVVSEIRALTYTLLIKLITFYLKLKFSNFWVPYQVNCLYLSLHVSFCKQHRN